MAYIKGVVLIGYGIGLYVSADFGACPRHIKLSESVRVRYARFI